MEIIYKMKLIIAMVSLHLSAAGMAAFLYHTDNRILPTRLNNPAKSASTPLALEERFFEKLVVAPAMSSAPPSAQVESKNLTVAPNVGYAELAKAWIQDEG